MAEPATAGTSGSIPTPTTAKSHPTRSPSASTAASSRSVPSHAATRPAASRAAPCAASLPADQGAERLAEDPLQRVPAGKDRGDLHPELGQGGRHLAADEPHAHHHRTPSP